MTPGVYYNLSMVKGKQNGATKTLLVMGTPIMQHNANVVRVNPTYRRAYPYLALLQFGKPKRGTKCITSGEYFFTLS